MLLHTSAAMSVGILRVTHPSMSLKLADTHRHEWAGEMRDVAVGTVTSSTHTHIYVRLCRDVNPCWRVTDSTVANTRHKCRVATQDAPLNNHTNTTRKSPQGKEALQYFHGSYLEPGLGF
jgi:hypothetical protein